MWEYYFKNDRKEAVKRQDDYTENQRSTEKERKI